MKNTVSTQTYENQKSVVQSMKKNSDLIICVR